MSLELHFKEEKEKILEKIKKANYPERHPFLDARFEGDFYHLVLAIFLKFTNGEVIVDDLIFKKLNGKVSGKFDNNRFQEGIGEFNVLYYLFCSFLLKSQHENISLKGIYYEPPAFVKGKTLEYGLDLKYWNASPLVAVEVKTIETAPEYRETSKLDIGCKYVKPYFSNISLDHLSDRADFDSLKYLECSTHYRQLSKNIKKINHKFCSKEGVINLGVVVFQYATSMDEIFSYLYHPIHGIYTKNPEHFDNLDALVFFSLTPTPDLMLNDLYVKNHVLTMCLTDDKWKIHILDFLRLGNYIFKNKSIEDWVLPYVDKEYGIFEYRLSNGMLFFINEENDIEQADKQAEEVSQKMKKLDRAYIPSTPQ